MRGRHSFPLGDSDIDNVDLAGLLSAKETFGDEAEDEVVKMAGKTFQQNTKVRSQIRIKCRESKLSDRRWFCKGGDEEESTSAILSITVSWLFCQWLTRREQNGFTESEKKNSLIVYLQHPTYQ